MLSHRFNADRALLLLIFLLVPSLAIADVVIPSDRVTRRVVVHEQASGTSRDIGSLRPGEHLKYLSSVPRWHRIELPRRACRVGDALIR